MELPHAGDAEVADTAGGDRAVAKTASAVVIFLGIAAVYAVAAKLGRELDYLHENARILLPQAGVGLASLLIFGVRYWPAIIAGSMLHQLSVPEKVRIVEALAFAMSNAVVAVLGAWLLLHVSNFRPHLRRIRDVYAFIAYGVVVAPLVGASLAVGAFFLIHKLRAQEVLPPFEDLLEIWWKRWFGIGISNLIVAPVLLTWSQRPGSYWPMIRIGELALLVSATFVVAVNVFTSQSAIFAVRYPLTFVPFPFVIWAALRFGPRGAATATLLTVGIAVMGTSQGFGPFVRLSPGEALLLLEIYGTAVALSGLFLAAAMAEHQTAERNLFQSREELRLLSAKLENAREQERGFIAREIHDELGQRLTSLKIGLRWLAKHIPPSDQKALEKCENLDDEVGNAVQIVRQIATALRPAILDMVGIVGAVRWLAEDFENKTGIRVRVEAPDADPALTQDAKTAVFRIVQETLTNVARHAQATAVMISISVGEENLSVEVRDNGRGFDPQLVDRRVSLGIAGMKERAGFLGGQLRIERAAAGAAEAAGTMVKLSLPLSGAPTQSSA